MTAAGVPPAGLAAGEALRQLEALLAAAEAALAADDLDALAATARAKGALVDALADAPPGALAREDLERCAARTRALGRAIAARRAQVDRRLWLLARATGRGIPVYGADGRLASALARPA